MHPAEFEEVEARQTRRPTGPGQLPDDHTATSATTAEVCRRASPTPRSATPLRSSGSNWPRPYAAHGQEAQELTEAALSGESSMRRAHTETDEKRGPTRPTSLLTMGVLLLALRPIDHVLP